MHLERLSSVCSLRQTQRIHGVNHRKKTDRIPRLVRLKVTDSMPAQRATAERNLGPGFLNLVFAKITHPQPRQGINAFRWMRLAHGHKRHTLRVASAAPAGRRNPLLNLFVALFQHVA